jgi:anti-repressor protein
MGNNIIELGLVERNGKAVVSRRDIARVFEKEHRHVLRSIREINCTDDFRVSNFGQSTYRNEQGHETPEYLLTRDGFTLIVMGYTGDKAMRFKEAYIAAFNEMEERLRTSVSIENLLSNPALLLGLLTKHIESQKENKRLQITAAKYEGQTDTVELYKVGEIAEELGTTAVTLNQFLKEKHVQYKPNGSKTWRLYSEYIGENLAFPRLVRIDSGREIPVLLWTPKGHDFIFDLVEREMPRWYA